MLSRAVSVHRFGSREDTATSESDLGQVLLKSRLQAASLAQSAYLEMGKPSTTRSLPTIPAGLHKSSHISFVRITV